MDQNNILILLIGMATLAIGTFFLGYETAEDNGKRAIRALRDRLRDEQNKKHQLTTWIRANWPNEYAAWERGHREGYQQGVLDSPKLNADDHA